MYFPLITNFVEFRPLPPKIILFNFLFVLSSILSSIFILQYLSFLQKIIYGAENDLLFPVSVSHLSPMTLICAFLLVYDITLKRLLRIPKIKKILIIYEEKPISKKEAIYAEMMRRRYFALKLIVLFIFILCSVIIFPVHIRINNTGIFYTKIFTFKEKYYEWDKLDSVSISFNEQDSSVDMELEFGGNKLSINGGIGIQPTSFREVLLAIDLIKQNTSIIINGDTGIPLIFRTAN